MGMYEMVFILQLLVVVSVFFLKLYNVMSRADFLSIKASFLFYIGFLLAYLSGLMTTLLSIDELIYFQLFRLEALILVLVSLFMIIELFLFLANKSTGYVSSRNSREFYDAKN